MRFLVRYQLRYFSLVEKVGLEPTTSRLEGEIFFAECILNPLHVNTTE